MSLLSKIRGRISDTVHAAEEAASGAAERAGEAAKGAAAMVKERARAIVAAPPAPSAASLAHAARAAVDAARNASQPAGNKKTEAGKGPGVFVGVGTSAAAGGDVGVGGQVSAGYVLGASGDVKSYGNTGAVNGALGAAAGVGLEAGLIVGDVRDFYGDGYQLSFCPPGAVSVNMAFTGDRELAAISVGVAKSTGVGVFHFDTRTEDTTGR